MARFETPLQAVQSYMHNLNTHRAYRRLREKRAQMQASGKKIRGDELAETLDQYSERRYAYVESLHAMMHYNHLWAADDAYLWDKEIIYLTPVSDPEPVIDKRVKMVAKSTRTDRDRNKTAKTKVTGVVSQRRVDSLENNESNSTLGKPVTDKEMAVKKSVKPAVSLSKVNVDKNRTIQTDVNSSEVFKSILDQPESKDSSRIQWEDN